jgi:hypothetical protein
LTLPEDQVNMVGSRRIKRVSASRLPVALLSGAAVLFIIAFSYILALLASINQLSEISADNEKLIGRPTIIRGTVERSYGVPLSKLAYYTVSDESHQVWVMSQTGAPKNMQKWVVKGIVANGFDGAGLAEKLRVLTGVPTSERNALSDLIVAVSRVKVGVYVVETSRHQWIAFPWL